MQKITKHILMMLGLLLFMSSQSMGQSKWVPIMMGDITTFVPLKSNQNNSVSISSVKPYYHAFEKEIAVNVKGIPSGSTHWAGVFEVGAESTRDNVILWNWVKNGVVKLDKKGNFYNGGIIGGKYEIRLFFDNSFHVEASNSLAIMEFFPPTGGIMINEDNMSHSVWVMSLAGLSGDKDWVGVLKEGDSNTWANIYEWNWVKNIENGVLKLNIKDNKVLTSGEYKVCLFFHNSMKIESCTSLSIPYVGDDYSYVYPPDTTLTEVGVEELARPEKTAFEDITKASVIDPAFGTTITRMHHQGPSGYSGYLYPKSQSWNADMSYLYLGYRLFNADTLVESDITKGLAVDGAGGTYNKLGYSEAGIFRWSHVNPKVFYTLQGVNALTFTKNTIIGTYVDHEVLFDFNNYGFELVQLGNGESHIDKNDKYVVFMAKKPNNDQMFAVLCDIQQPNAMCKVEALEDSIWGVVHVDDDNDGIYNTRSVFDWIDISPNGDHIIVNKTVNAIDYIDKKVKSVETAIYMYDLNFGNRQKIANTGGHGDLGLAENGNQVYVQFEWRADERGIFSYNLDAPEGQREKKVLSDTYGGGHISCQNYNRPGWCYLSTNYNGGEYNEVFALKLDGSQTVNRFVKARSSHGPYAGVSPDGKRVVYLSNWDDDNTNMFNMYHVGLKK